MSVNFKDLYLEIEFRINSFFIIISKYVMQTRYTLKMIFSISQVKTVQFISPKIYSGIRAGATVVGFSSLYSPSLPHTLYPSSIFSRQVSHFYTLHPHLTLYIHLPYSPGRFLHPYSLHPYLTLYIYPPYLPHTLYPSSIFSRQVSHSYTLNPYFILHIHLPYSPGRFLIPILSILTSHFISIFHILQVGFCIPILSILTSHFISIFHILQVGFSSLYSPSLPHTSYPSYIFSRQVSHPYLSILTSHFTSIFHILQVFFSSLHSPSLPNIFFHILSILTLHSISILQVFHPYTLHPYFTLYIYLPYLQVGFLSISSPSLLHIYLTYSTLHPLIFGSKRMINYIQTVIFFLF